MSISERWYRISSSSITWSVGIVYAGGSKSKGRYRCNQHPNSVTNILNLAPTLSRYPALSPKWQKLKKVSRKRNYVRFEFEEYIELFRWINNWGKYRWTFLEFSYSSQLVDNIINENTTAIRRQVTLHRVDQTNEFEYNALPRVWTFTSLESFELITLQYLCYHDYNLFRFQKTWSKKGSWKVN